MNTPLKSAGKVCLFLALLCSGGATAHALPDLIVWGPAVVPQITTETFTTNDCAVMECAVPGTRRLLRFDTQTRNIGTSDLILGDPTTNSLFHYDACHQHYHLEGYADYRLRDSNGVVAVGQKIGFCLLDSIRWDTTNSNPNYVYDCSNQGIQKGWGDVYTSGLTCQWIDITDLPGGTYTLELEVNPDHVLAESDYSNNVASVTVTIPSCRAMLISNTPPNDLVGGNGNGAADPGEVLQEMIVVRNTGCPATNVVATLSTTTPGVTVLDPISTYPDIPGGSAATNLTAFRYRVAKSVPCGTAIQFAHVTASGTEFFTNFFVRFVGSIATTNVTLAAADTPKAILDVATIYSTNVVNLPGTNILQQVSVSVRLNHTYDADLVVALQHPDGTEVVLSANRGSSGDNFGAGNNTCSPTAFTVFSDSGLTAIANGIAPFTASTFRPESALSVFAGKNPNGPWRLRVSDTASVDTGTLGCWKLTLTAVYGSYNCVSFNHPPVASNATLSAVADASSTLAVTGSDLDEEPITFTVGSAPAHGLLSAFNLVTGEFTYTPAHGFAGSDSFTFRANDGVTNSALATLTLSVPPWTDTNANGLPDVWEVARGVTDPDADPDGDGQTNLQEYLANTNPTNAASALRIPNVDCDPAGHFVLTWSSVGGVRYRILYSDGDANGDYNGIFIELVRPVAAEMDPAPVGTDSNETFTDDFALTGGPPPQGKRYYRIEVVR